MSPAGLGSFQKSGTSSPETGSVFDTQADFIGLDANNKVGNHAATIEEEDEDEEEDDYMTMAIPTDASNSTKKLETSLQRRQREKREAEARARPKSKAEIKAAEVEQRETALAQSMDSDNKGFRMMAKLGFKAGGALGKEGGDGRTEPLGINVREGRGGIGLDEERKRKVWEELNESVKRTKADEGEYWERLKGDREEKRREGQIWGAMNICEKMDESEEDAATIENPAHGKAQERTSEAVDVAEIIKPKRASKPLQSIPVLWRTLARQRLEKERARKMRHDLQQSLSRLPTYDDPDEDEDDKRAFGREVEELEEEDPELEEFLALPSEERLAQLVQHLRQTHHYCFWCKYKYPDEEMEGCPGLTEEDHD